MSRPILRTALCDLLGVEYPIFLAAMGAQGKATPPKLAAAVSNAGGIGMIGGSGLSPDGIRRRIREVRTLTDKPFGVGLLLPASLASGEKPRSAIRQQLVRDYPEHIEFVKGLLREYNLPEVYVEDEAVYATSTIREQVQVLLEEKVPMFSAGLGDPSWVVPLARKQGMKVIGLVGSVRNALRQAEAGVDIVVAQGNEAGGHTGKIATFPLIPQVVDAVKPTPVVAAGGIGDGRGVAAALTLGAVGAWVGTAFLAALECDIPDNHKDEIIQGRAEDFVITRSYTGKTARDYNNVIIEAWERSGLEPLPMPLQKVLMDDFVEAAARAARFDLINNPAGQIGGLVVERRPGAQILTDMVHQAAEIIEQLQRSVSFPVARP